MYFSKLRNFGLLKVIGVEINFQFSKVDFNYNKLRILYFNGRNYCM